MELQSWIFILVSENNPFLILGSGTSSARNENLRPLLNRNIPLISGRYDLKIHFWPLESIFLMRKSEKKGPNFWGTLLPILRLTFLESSCNFWKIGLKKKWWVFFFDLTGLQDQCVQASSPGILDINEFSHAYDKWSWPICISELLLGVSLYDKCISYVV